MSAFWKIRSLNFLALPSMLEYLKLYKGKKRNAVCYDLSAVLPCSINSAHKAVFQTQQIWQTDVMGLINQSCWGICDLRLISINLLDSIHTAGKTWLMTFPKAQSLPKKYSPTHYIFNFLLSVLKCGQTWYLKYKYVN